MATTGKIHLSSLRHTRFSNLASSAWSCTDDAVKLDECASFSGSEFEEVVSFMLTNNLGGERRCGRDGASGYRTNPLVFLTSWSGTRSKKRRLDLNDM